MSENALPPDDSFEAETALEAMVINRYHRQIPLGISETSQVLAAMRLARLAALPPDEREALAAEIKRLADEFAEQFATPNATMADSFVAGKMRESLHIAIDRLARLAVQGGDAGKTDSVGASHFVGPGSAASRPEPLCVSALRAPIPGAEDDV